MIIPLLMFALGLFVVLGYFTRKQITYTYETTKGSLGVAIIAFVIFAVVGYFLDVYLGFSMIFQYMFAVGGALQAIAIVFWAAFIMLMLSMLWSSAKVGRMVS